MIEDMAKDSAKGDSYMCCFYSKCQGNKINVWDKLWYMYKA